MRQGVRVRWSKRQGGASGEPADGPSETRHGAAPESFNPFTGDAFRVPDPALTAAERQEAEIEGREGIPGPDAAAPSPGERRVESRFVQAIARMRTAADRALGRLQAAQHQVRTDAIRVEAEAARERERIRSLAAAEPACQRIDALHARSQAAEKELAGFRRKQGLPDYATPRESGRGWVWLLLAVALAETTANGLLLHAASTEGVVSNWLFAALVTAMNVGLLGWLIGDLIFRRMLGGGALRRGLLAAALLPCLALAVLLHFGFAHYRDAVQALDGARAAAVLDLDDIDAGAGDAAVPPDPHPPEPLSVEQAVISELRAQFLWWRPGTNLVVHPDEAPADDHSLDTVRPLAAGEVGYRTADGGLVLAEDPLAGRFEGWRSVLLLGVGFAALFLAAWKWFGGREPIPHFSRLHGVRERTSAATRDLYARSLEALNDEELRHRQRLGDHEAALLSLGGRLTELDGTRDRVLADESELVARTAAAGATAVADFRQANRQRRLSHDPVPAFWNTPWSPEAAPRSEDGAAVWERGREAGLFEVMQAAERVRLANLAHTDPAARAFAEARERLAHAARIPGARRRAPTPPGGSPPSPPGGKEVRLVPSREPKAGPRLEIAS
jgi:hypothetical protein